MTSPTPLRSFRWLDPPAGPAIELLDQTRLPAEEVFVTCSDVPQLIDAISRLVVRGAPMLGVAGAFGVALAAARGDDVPAAAAAIAGSRPTAVNLGWGARLALQAWRTAGGEDEPVPVAGAAARAALAQARDIAEQDAAASTAMARHGLELVPAGARILTHCNTGCLVSAGEGTAFAVILAAHRAGRLAQLWIDETRPLLQGARLTAWEAARAGMPHTLLADSAAAALMASGQVDLVMTGADRVAADGSVANKVARTAWRCWPGSTACHSSSSRRSRLSTWPPPTVPRFGSSSGPTRRWPASPGGRSLRPERGRGTRLLT